jgi:NADH:ubiquinone oxidoreductase subunit 4 (chain M)
VLIATTVVIFAAAYLLWAIQRILFGRLVKPENKRMPDLNRRELLIMGVLAAAILWIGIYPAPMLNRMERSAGNFVEQVQNNAVAAQTPRLGMRGGR